MKLRAGMYRTAWLLGRVFNAHMFRVSHKQWEVAILILINTSASIKFRIVKMDKWLNLNKHPCRDSICDPFVSEANPWTAGLCYLWKPSKILPFYPTTTTTHQDFSDPLRGYCTPGPYFWRLCAFSQKRKQLRTKYPMDLVRNVPKNSKITVLLQ